MRDIFHAFLLPLVFVLVFFVRLGELSKTIVDWLIANI
jgi:hypothetical protein